MQEPRRSQKVQSLREATDIGHDAVWVAYPVPPPKGGRKRIWRETLVHRIFCRRCCGIAPKAEGLAKKDCVLSHVSGALYKMLSRLRTRLEDPNISVAIKAATQHTVDTLGQSFEKVEGNAGHHVEAVAWPGDEWSVKFLCGGCGAFSDAEGNIKGQCSRFGHRRPGRAIVQLRGFVAEGGGARNIAARYILERLGYPAVTKDAGESVSELAVGLGQGP